MSSSPSSGAGSWDPCRCRPRACALRALAAVGLPRGRRWRDRWRGRAVVLGSPAGSVGVSVTVGSPFRGLSRSPSPSPSGPGDSDTVGLGELDALCRLRPGVFVDVSSSDCRWIVAVGSGRPPCRACRRGAPVAFPAFLVLPAAGVRVEFAVAQALAWRTGRHADVPRGRGGVVAGRGAEGDDGAEDGDEPRPRPPRPGSAGRGPFRPPTDLPRLCGTVGGGTGRRPGVGGGLEVGGRPAPRGAATPTPSTCASGTSSAAVGASVSGTPGAVGDEGRRPAAGDRAALVGEGAARRTPQARPAPGRAVRRTAAWDAHSWWK
ncbi:hypothetical protein SALBM217S_05799 [Streptomyces griseoloalbus]